MQLTEEAVQNGARSQRACAELGISLRSLQRWKLEPESGDQRAGPHRRPSNALSDAERALVVAVATSPQFRESPPSQIVPTLADMDIYVGSESSFYRILKEERLAAPRGKARAAGEVRRPDEHVAGGPNQVWSWDITYCAPGLWRWSETISGARACLEYSYKEQGGDDVDDCSLLRESMSRSGGDLLHTGRVT